MNLNGLSEELKNKINEYDKKLKDQLDKSGFWSFKQDKIYNAIMKYEIERARHSTLAKKYNAMVDERTDLQNRLAKLDQKAAKPIRDHIKSLDKKMDSLRKDADKQAEKVLTLESDWKKAGEILDKRLAEVEKKEQKRNNCR